MYLDEDEREEYIEKVKKTSYAAGRREGEMLKLISQIQKKVKKGKSVVEIAEELEEAIDMMELIYDMVTAYPEGTKEAVYQRMNN